MTTVAALQLQRVQVERGGITILEGVDLDVQHGEFVCLLGPSGCGKTTLLDLAAGLATPTSGRVHCMGQPVRDVNLHSSYLFQQDALLPWCTVLNNASLPLRLRGLPSANAEIQARRWLERVGLANFYDYYPAQLSGGMRKRVALVQLLIQDAPLLLMDEPFAALDALTRQAMHALLLELWEHQRKAVLFVTHDLDEALALADRIIMLTTAPAARCLPPLAIDLPRPRHLPGLRNQAQYRYLHQHLWHMLNPSSAFGQTGAKP